MPGSQGHKDRLGLLLRFQASLLKLVIPVPDIVEYL